ncbi:MAG: Ldh family oxidoreductase [Chloroflexota bacterium]|nr:Ldh family oxidoreductase [Chloroflexota bacterium]
MNEIRIDHNILVSAIAERLARVSMPDPVRAIEAKVMTEADLLGVPSHGVRMLPGLVQAIENGHVNPEPRLALVRDHAAICTVDGDRGPGRYISVQAMNLAVERAKRFGVGTCVAANTSHWGRAHAYAYRAAQQGMIGICTTNAISSMLSWDSDRSLLGNNPLAIGVPRGADRPPVVLDIAMSQAAIGKIATYRREGRPVPMGWGLNATGQPTNNPAAILDAGKFLPFGDHKGAGLSFMLELLTGALAGGLLCFEFGGAATGYLDVGSSKLFLALDLAAFIEPTIFFQRVEDMIDFIHTAEPERHHLYPGQRGWQARAENLVKGVPLHPDIVAELTAAGVVLPITQ